MEGAAPFGTPLPSLGLRWTQRGKKRKQRKRGILRGTCSRISAVCECIPGHDVWLCSAINNNKIQHFYDHVAAHSLAPSQPTNTTQVGGVG